MTPQRNEATTQSTLAYLQAFGDARFRDGVNAGLEELERFVDWMTLQPDTKRQQQQRQWMQQQISEFKKKYGIL